MADSPKEVTEHDPYTNGNIRYYGWKEEPVTCQKCGWKGKAEDCFEDMDMRAILLDCPKCKDTGWAVLYPTAAETRAAAGKGNKDAVGELPFVEMGERCNAEFHKQEVTNPDQLPDIEGERLEFVWEGRNDPIRNVVLCEGEVIWSGPHPWESWPLFNEVSAMLKERYGDRFVRLEPTQASLNWLYGDTGAEWKLEKE